ncbi:hypothetical protein CapIbe_001048 [Capra ibex]
MALLLAKHELLKGADYETVRDKLEVKQNDKVYLLWDSEAGKKLQTGRTGPDPSKIGREKESENASKVFTLISSYSKVDSAAFAPGDKVARSTDTSCLQPRPSPAPENLLQ